LEQQIGDDWLEGRGATAADRGWLG